VEGMHSVTENSATIWYADKNEVFYNPVQETNRDLSIMVIKQFIKTREIEWAEKMKKRREKNPDAEDFPLRKVRILEALSASGLRSIRFCKELVSPDNGDSLLDHVLINDIEPAAVESIRRNLKANDVPETLGIPHLGDATQVMYNHRKKEDQFDVIDLDPYGSAAIFLDGAVQSIADGGLLCITCTDLKVLCGNHPEVCFSKYNAIPLKGKMAHEMALRMLLSSLEMHAIRYKRHIVPLCGLYIDFYIRVFVRVFTSPLTVKSSPGKFSQVFQCTGCGSLHFQPLGKITPGVAKNDIKASPATGPVVNRNCAECESIFRVGGPIWSEPIVEGEFLKGVVEHLKANEKLYGHAKRVGSMLTALSEEVHTAPLFHSTGEMASVLRCIVPPRTVIASALLKHGYAVSASHCDPAGIKTNAPVSLLWDFFRRWEKEHPITRREPNALSYKILDKPASVEIDLSVSEEIADKKKKRRNEGPRFLPNPREGWGPGSRAHGGRKRRKVEEEEMSTEEKEEEKKEEEKEDEKMEG